MIFFLHIKTFAETLSISLSSNFMPKTIFVRGPEKWDKPPKVTQYQINKFCRVFPWQRNTYVCFTLHRISNETDLIWSESWSIKRLLFPISERSLSYIGTDDKWKCFNPFWRKINQNQITLTILQGGGRNSSIQFGNTRWQHPGNATVSICTAI